MHIVTVVFEVDEEHNIVEREGELFEELERIQENSEVGLVVRDVEIRDEVESLVIRNYE